jgi:hypothetical protein
MEIIQSRYGLDRTIEKIDANRIRVMGESQFQRVATNDAGEVTMFDFEGGPVLSVGGEIYFQKSKWVIKNIEPVASKFEGLSECILTVSLKY